MRNRSPYFKDNAAEALNNASLQQALKNLQTGFIEKRAKAVSRLPEFEVLRDRARDIKDHTLAHLDLYLQRFEEKVQDQGGQVHWALTARDACHIILQICKRAQAKTVIKSKSMISEEIGLNEHLQTAGLNPIETDLGEYIIQMRKEPPSHIIAPAIHVNKQDVARDFRKFHVHLPPARSLEDPASLLTEARAVLRDTFFKADVGITGANFLVAETGSALIVTNEGNADLTHTLPKVHIVIASIEKIVPTLADVSQILRVLARSATGQEMTVYNSLTTGPRRAEDPDGPEKYHVVLLDNGRSDMLGTEFQEMLRCIRCGACMNHCPVYHAVGGHAYGWVYPGPMGAVLTPALSGIEKSSHLPNASTFCGRCEAVCPMRIPLPKMMRHWREKAFEKHLVPKNFQRGLKFWAWLAKRPRLYRITTRMGIRILGWMGRRKGSFRRMMFAKGWTQYRNFPAPEAETFQSQWQKHIKASSLSTMAEKGDFDERT